MTILYESVLRPTAAGIPPNVDLRSILADLADNDVSAPQRDQSGLAAVARDAREDGLPVSIVIVANRPPEQANLRDLATAVGEARHGTVVVINGDWAGTYSDSISRYRLERAEDAAKSPHASTSEAAQAFVNDLKSESAISWTAITCIILAIVFFAIVGLHMVKVREAVKYLP
ncbi:Rv1476 family membrane protein [Nocardia gamkensis]|uniref:Rv1476 family membrane protein n=1 Tax=Nocardia gamkensis TaxID=352869 RepID=UPI0037CC7E5F